MLWESSENQFILPSEGSRIFHEGADFQKSFQNFVNFFKSTKLIFQTLPKHKKDPVLDEFSATQANI